MGLMQPWAKEKEELLRELFVRVQEGYYLSHGYIASLMGLSRTAVIGKIHRLKLERDKTRSYLTQEGKVIDPTVTSFRAKAPRVKAEKPVMVKSHNFHGSIKKIRAPVVNTGPGEYMGETTITACQVVDLDGDKCHFPIGHVGKEGFHFCGGPAVRSTPYCGYHANICLNPAQPRADQRLRNRY